MNTPPIRVGLIGASPDRGWAASAHIPALRAMPQFDLAAVCTTRQESADATARKFGIQLAFADWRAMMSRPDIDLVMVTVKVPFHRELAMAALAAGKHVFCEWPLGLGTEEAKAIADAARQSGKRHMVGLQARAHPLLIRLKALVDEGRIGRVLSCTLVSSLASWGPRLPPAEEYRADRANGATGLTIPGGHSLDALTFCVGDFRDLSAILTTQHPQTEIIGTGRTVPVTSPDQVLISGTLASGAVASVHIKADTAVPMGVRFEINGTDGDLLLRSRIVKGKDPVGIQRADMTLSLATRGAADYAEVPAPAGDDRVPPSVPAGPPFFTAQLLARLADAIQTGAPASPDFDDAVACHQLLDTVQRAADSGHRVVHHSSDVVAGGL